MTLLIDIGNTRIKLALAEGDSLFACESVTHRGADWQTPLSNFLQRHPPQNCYLASVAALDVTEAIAQFVSHHWAREPVQVRSEAQRLGVTNGYEHPERLGVDRWLAMIAAYGQLRRGVCVVDSGTATTLDLLDATGRHLGGLILPGLDLARYVLQNQTARIKVTGADEFQEWPLLASTTEGAVRGGMLHATVALVEKLCEGVGDRPQLVVTGGAAPALVPYLPRAHHVPNLVMDGLRRVAQECG